MEDREWLNAECGVRNAEHNIEPRILSADVPEGQVEIARHFNAG